MLAPECHDHPMKADYGLNVYYCSTYPKCRRTVPMDIRPKREWTRMDKELDRQTSRENKVRNENM